MRGEDSGAQSSEPSQPCRRHSGGNAQTCFEDGLRRFAPRAPSVSQDGDGVSLARLQARHWKTALAASELLLNSLSNEQ